MVGGGIVFIGAFIRVLAQLWELVGELLGDLEIDRLLMNNQEIFTSEELKENDERESALIKLVASGETILIVGAGSSVRVGYPDWARLVKELEHLAFECGEDFTSDCTKHKCKPLAYAEQIKLHIDKKGKLDRYHALLQNLFSPKDPPCKAFHRRLVSLPFKGILTTNYDTVLEAALCEREQLSAYDNSVVVNEDYAGQVDKFLLGINDRNIPRRIAHLHGRYDNPRSIILSSEDYQKVYGLNSTGANRVQTDSESTLHQKLLWSVSAARRLVFVGFSLNDPYFNRILETVSNDLWRWGKSIHFAIMNISPESAKVTKAKARCLKREYAVDTVFYEDADNSHQGLDRIVAEIDSACRFEDQRTTPSPQDLYVNNDRSEGKISGLDARESPDLLELLNQVNKRMLRRISDED